MTEMRVGLTQHNDYDSCCRHMLRTSLSSRASSEYLDPGKGGSRTER